MKTNPTAVASTSWLVFCQLVLMMLLQYFVQGCYQPIAALYVDKSLHFSEMQIALFLALLAVGPLFAPFIVGQLVDRMFATQKVLACCHLLGGVLMLGLYWQGNLLIDTLATSASNTPNGQVRFYTLTVMTLATLYSILFVPSIMLTNAMAFHHLADKDREFPRVRLFGTIGFVVPAYLIEFWWLRGLEGDALHRARGIAFAFAGIAGIVMGFYSLCLPHTPPKTDLKKPYAPGVVMTMLRQRHFLVLVLVTFFVAIVHKFFFVWNGSFLREILDSGGIKGGYEQSISSIGQIFEVVVMVGLGFFIKRFGFKAVMLTGAMAYMLRCVLFGLVFSVDLSFGLQLTLACTGQALHGLCFGCFLAAGFIYVDRICAPDVRGSMQTLYGTFVISLGFFVGSFVAGGVAKIFTTETGRDWSSIWLSCAALAALCVLAFGLLFPKDAGLESPVAEPKT
ncbi:MAG TPA: hypothetical protein DCY79_16305 [Planctomycetaceae bacterium]|nr:hypothetical protein [Planctomycetaceae bacterium]